MVLLLDIAKKSQNRSERVKSIDFHPTEPWVVVALYSGQVVIYHSERGTVIRTFDVTEVPVRCVKFIARKNWLVCGSDDFYLRVYNYNTGEKIVAIEAHPDYVRCLAVHPSQPIVLTGSDDLTIKQWDWDKGWQCTRVYEGHSHYIMNIAFNPKDNTTFASSSLDRTVKVWSLTSPVAHFTLDAHERGVNYVEYYPGGDKPYMLTVGDDMLIKVWDYLSKSCIQVLSGHQSVVSFAFFHPHLPLIVSGSEDGTVKLWHSVTYRLEKTLDYGLDRAWCGAYGPTGSTAVGNDIAVGYDHGSVVIRLGHDEPRVSMDPAGKVVWSKDTTVYTTAMSAAVAEWQRDELERRGAPEGDDVVANSYATSTAGAGGALSKLPQPAVREMGTTDVYVQSLKHSPNGRFVAVTGNGEFVIYTALAWRNKAFGPGIHFAWAPDSNTFAVRDISGNVTVWRSFKENPALLPPGLTFAADEVFEGALLAVKGVTPDNTGFVIFFDWESGRLVSRIDIDNVRDVIWNPAGNKVAIASADTIYILTYNHAALQETLASGVPDNLEGIDGAFEIITDVSESYRSGRWVGDAFVFTTTTNRLSYIIGDHVRPIAHMDVTLFILGYLSQPQVLVLSDANVNFYVHPLPLPVIEYQSAILAQDFEVADAILTQSIPKALYNDLARFVDSLGYHDIALGITTDEAHKFDLAVQLGNLDLALSLLSEAPQSDSATEQKWRSLGDKALADWNVNFAADCLSRAQDLSSLLLIYAATANKEALAQLAYDASERGLHNIAFNAAFLAGDAAHCVDLLINTARYPEAALFARTYIPSLVHKTVDAWKGSFDKRQSKQAAWITEPEYVTPAEYDHLEQEQQEQQPLQDQPSVADQDPSSFAPSSIPSNQVPAVPAVPTVPPVSDIPSSVPSAVPAPAPDADSHLLHVPHDDDLL